MEILGHDFKISFPAGHESDLKEAADYLNKEMQTIKNTSKANNMEKIAMLTALNITHDFLSTLKSNSKQEQKIKQLTELLDATLDQKNNTI